jgi:hypothetical protein
MTSRKLSELPYFSGKELALEVHKRGIEVFGADNLTASDLMLIGLIQVVEELRDEVRYLKEAQL